MTHHFHLIVTPQAETENISKLMRLLATRQTRCANKAESRAGALWEGRFKASLIDTTMYLLASCRYVDLNPVRAAMVASPDEYCWSSYRGHVGVI
jgi:putative transposase